MDPSTIREPVAAESLHGGARWGLFDLVGMLVLPGPVFERWAVKGPVMSAFLVLITLQTLIGVFAVRSGVHEREIDLVSQSAILAYEKSKTGTDDPKTLLMTIDSMEKMAVFSILLNNTILIVREPLCFIATLLCTGSFVFAVVAVSGGKPKFGQAMTVAILAAVQDLIRQVAACVLLYWSQTSRVDLSAAIWASPSTDVVSFLLLRRLDWFSIWYWLLVGYGLFRSRQLTARPAAMVALTLFIGAASVGLAADLLNPAYIDLSKVMTPVEP